MNTNIVSMTKRHGFNFFLTISEGHHYVYIYAWSVYWVVTLSFLQWLLLATNQKLKANSGYWIFQASFSFNHLKLPKVGDFGYSKILGWGYLVTLKYLRLLFGYFEISRGCHQFLQTHKQTSKFRLQRLLQAQACTHEPHKNTIICQGFEPLPIKALPIAKKMTYKQCDKNAAVKQTNQTHQCIVDIQLFTSSPHLTPIAHTHNTTKSTNQRQKK